MRPGGRILGFSVTVMIAVALVAPAVVLAEGAETVTDSFGSPTYSGGTGWTTSWAEAGDDGNVSSGVVQIVSSSCDGSFCVRFSAPLSLGSGLGRTTDISDAESATLAFTYLRQGIGTLQVWTRSGPTDPWTTRNLTGGTSGYASAEFDITSDASSTTEVRFTADLVLAQARIDNVSITATYPASTTTTSTTTTTTTTSTSTSTSTTTLPITIPTVTTTTITIPLPTTSTTSTTTTTSTTLPTTTSTSTTTPSTGTSTTQPTAGGGEPGVPPPEDPGLPTDPLTPEEVELAGDNNIAVGLAASSDFQSFGLGINPLTDLSVALLATVETISSGIVSALLLGGAIAFFAIRRVDREEEDPRT